MRARTAALALAALLAGCGGDPSGGPAFTFSRLGGVLRGVKGAPPLSVECGGKSREVRARRAGLTLLLAFSWNPRERCTIRWGTGPARHIEGTAPLLADPVPIRIVDLEGIVPRKVEAGLADETTFLLFSPSGRRIALGTRGGFVRVLDADSGKVVFRKRIAEGMAKAAAFSPDGRTLFIGEQTRDGFLRAVDLRTGRERWRYRLADDLESSTPWDPGNELAWVEYPGPYRIAVTPEGDLLVGALHIWHPDRTGRIRHLSHLYRFDGESGALRWKWPKEGPIALKLTWFATDEAMTAAVGVLGSVEREGETPPDPPGLYAVNLRTGKLIWRHAFRPLLPYFRSVNTWRSVGVRPDGRFVSASTGDGRLFILEEGRLRWTDLRGGPVMVSGFPVVAETGSLGATRDFAIFALGGGYIPLQAGPKGAGASQIHPNQNALLIFDWQGKLRWRWPTPNRPNGLALSRDGRWLAVALSRSRALRREDVNGLALFDLKATGDHRLAGEYRTEGIVPYDQVALSLDGTLIALVETPAVIPDGRPPQGRHRLHILY